MADKLYPYPDFVRLPPRGFKYIAQDASGLWCAFTDEPTVCLDVWVFTAGDWKVLNTTSPSDEWNRYYYEVVR